MNKGQEVALGLILAILAIVWTRGGKLGNLWTIATTGQASTSPGDPAQAGSGAALSGIGGKVGGTVAGVAGALSIDGVIQAAAQRHGVSPAGLLALAKCESSLNPSAHNASGADGLFQFKPATFRANGGTDLRNPADQADVAAKMISQGQLHQWECGHAYTAAAG